MENLPEDVLLYLFSFLSSRALIALTETNSRLRFLLFSKKSYGLFFSRHASTLPNKGKSGNPLKDKFHDDNIKYIKRPVRFANFLSAESPAVSTTEEIYILRNYGHYRLVNIKFLLKTYLTVEVMELNNNCMHQKKIYDVISRTETLVEDAMRQRRRSELHEPDKNMIYRLKLEQEETNSGFSLFENSHDLPESDHNSFIPMNKNRSASQSSQTQSECTDADSESNNDLSQSLSSPASSFGSKSPMMIRDSKVTLRKSKKTNKSVRNVKRHSSSRIDIIADDIHDSNDRMLTEQRDCDETIVGIYQSDSEKQYNLFLFYIFNSIDNNNENIKFDVILLRYPAWAVRDVTSKITSFGTASNFWNVFGQHNNSQVGRILVTGHDNGKINIWKFNSLNAGTNITIDFDFSIPLILNLRPDLKNPFISCVNFADAGVFSGDSNGLIHFHDPIQGQEITNFKLAPQPRRVIMLHYLPNLNKLFVFYSDSAIFLFDSIFGTLLREINCNVEFIGKSNKNYMHFSILKTIKGDAGSGTAVKFVTGTSDGVVRLYSFSFFQPIAAANQELSLFTRTTPPMPKVSYADIHIDITEFKGHSDAISSVAICSRCIISSSLDGTIKIWDPETIEGSKLIRTFKDLFQKKGKTFIMQVILLLPMLIIGFKSDFGVFAISFGNHLLKNNSSPGAKKFPEINTSESPQQRSNKKLNSRSSSSKVSVMRDGDYARLTRDFDLSQVDGDVDFLCDLYYQS